MNFPFKILLLFFILLIEACHERIDSNSEVVNSNEHTFLFPQLNDQTDISITRRSFKWMNTASYRPLYFGNLNETLTISYKVSPFPPPYPYDHEVDEQLNIEASEKYYDSIRNNLPYKEYFTPFPPNSNDELDSSNIEIQIDTSQQVINLGNNNYADSINIFSAFPVLLINKLDEPILIGYGNHISLIMEAMYPDSTWKPIESPFVYKCGTGLPLIILPPNELAITSAIKYSGEYSTNLRLKIGTTYSSIFKGSINITQFDEEIQN